MFVSSTCYDLIDLRAELEEELRQLGLTPVMSDQPSAEFEVLPNQKSIETCLTASSLTPSKPTSLTHQAVLSSRYL